MKQAEEKAPFKIQAVLTDNGKSFADRFTRADERKPSGRHPFDQECQAHSIEHRLIKPGRSQTNGMVERFNGRISDVLANSTVRIRRGPGTDAEAIRLAVQSPYSAEGVAPSIIDCSDEGIAGQAAQANYQAGNQSSGTGHLSAYHKIMQPRSLRRGYSDVGLVGDDELLNLYILYAE